MNLGVRIKQAREVRNITQLEFSKMIGLDKSVMNRIELGTRPVRDDEIVAISNALGISSDELLGTEKVKSYKIPVFGQVAAGNPIFASDEVVDYEEIPIEWKGKGEFFAVRLKGDSMLPRFAEGDVVIVRKQDSVDSGDLAIVLVNGDEATFKKVEKLDNGLMLIGLNSSYIPRVYTNEDIERLPVKIIGKVVEARIKL